MGGRGDEELVISFWGFWRQGVEVIDKNYDKLAIFEKSHPKYNKFVKILQNKIFINKNVRLTNDLLNLQPIGVKEYWKYRIRDMEKSRLGRLCAKCIKKTYSIVMKSAK